MDATSGYTCKIIFRRATDVPIADINDLSCDPYLDATLSSRSDTSQVLKYRTQTVRQSLNPTFDSPWIVAGIPSTGFSLSLILIDEDPGNADDVLGDVKINFPDLAQSDGPFTDGWDSGEREYKIYKRHGSLIRRTSTYVAKILTHGKIDHHTRVYISVRVLGKTQQDDPQRIFTLGPHIYVQHFSPLIGTMLGASKAPNANTKSSLKASAFVANRIQLTGPVPPSLRHRYVGFAPFVKAMFRKKGIKGILLNRALHRQHHSIYKWDKNTVFGVVEELDRDSGKPSEAFARQFLHMTAHGTGGRIFTYAIMLDGQWRFTQTGANLAIGLLSKHTMHTDVAIEIAYSGEFFVRRLHSRPDDHSTDDNRVPSDYHDLDDGDDVDDDPRAYELVIDNDSGTYRPRTDLLPTLQRYLSAPANLGALGKITAMDGFDEKLQAWKKERAETMRGDGRAAQALAGSNGSSASSVSGERLGLHSGTSVSSEQVERVLEEDAKRARDNEDRDKGAQDEENAVAARGEAKDGQVADNGSNIPYQNGGGDGTNK